MKSQYTDVYGKIHILGDEIKRGGQGVVYRTLNPNIVIKIELNNDGTVVQTPNPAYEEIRLLPFPRDLNLTLPLAPLKDVSGYTMYLLDDMYPFSKFFSDKSNVESEKKNNLYLQQFESNTNEQATEIMKELTHYISTGGNCLRLEAFFKCACLLARLHAAGFVYGDISDNNVFIAKNDENLIVWLIDSDNVNYQDKTSKKIFGTPGYNAPELVEKRFGNTFYSDIYAFAIACFNELYGCYPFKGQYFIEHEEDFEFADDADDKAFSGTLPWILDEIDNSNAPTKFSPGELFFSETKSLMRIFSRTFSEKGRKNRILRPSMMEWSFILGKETDSTIRCYNCHMGYNKNYFKNCPVCDNKTSYIEIISRIQSQKVWNYCKAIQKNKLVNIPLRGIEGLKLESVDRNAFSIVFKDDAFIFSNFNDEYEFYVVNHENKALIYNEYTFRNNCNFKCINKSSNIEYLLEIKKV